MVQSSDSQSAVPRLAASASPGNSLDMQILRPHPRFVESETGGEVTVCVLKCSFFR